MTAVLIPPSPQPETAAGDANKSKVRVPDNIAERIVQKVHSGSEEVTQKDLLEFAAAISLRTARTNGDGNGTSSTVASGGEGSFTQARRQMIHTPLVNRAYIKSCDSNPKVVVKYIGMVQDMLDPEYYVSRVNGVHTKYREYYCLNHDGADGTGTGMGDGFVDEIAMSHLLEERQPLVLVPVPNSTKVLRDCIRNLEEQSNAEIMKEETLDLDETISSDVSRRKRPLEDDTTENEIQSVERSGNHGKKNLRSPPISAPSSSSTATVNGRGCSWWSEGCMNSDPEQVPVLAKMYYPEHEESSTSGGNTAQPVPPESQPQQPRLQLNDIVEVYGILSLDPLGASFEDQKPNGNDPSADSSSNFETQQEAFFNDFMDPMVLPPPSLLPRLHVLKYKKLDLDELVVKGHDNDELEQGVEDGVEGVMTASVSVDSGRQVAIDAFARCIFNGNKIASEALLMACMSLAERDYRASPPKAIQMPSGATLGCGSINFVLSTTNACSKLQERLTSVLGMTSPVVATINLSLPSLNGTATDAGQACSDSIIAPGKNASNRLEPSVLQLPKASCVIINQAKMTEGKVNQTGESALASLSKMVRTHTIPYRFDGLMEIDFEADHKVVVVSSNNDKPSTGRGGSRLLPCALTMKLGSDSITECGAGSPSLISDKTFGQICRYLSKCRSSQKSIALPKCLLERAQKDFINWRKNGLSPLKRDVEEDDFHRWLLLTRLRARCRMGNKESNSDDLVATVQDWENAVHLDCKMQVASSG